jgi:hypothetical protein
MSRLLFQQLLFLSRHFLKAKSKIPNRDRTILLITVHEDILESQD